MDEEEGVVAGVVGLGAEEDVEAVLEMTVMVVSALH